MARKLSERLKGMPRMRGLAKLIRDKFPKRAKMPKEVDIVTAKDISCGSLSGHGDNMKHCLLGLSMVNFGNYVRGERLDGLVGIRPTTIAEKYVNKELEKSVQAFTGNDSMLIVDFNDDEMGNNEKYWIAKVWNATMARLGYTEGNPEAK